MIVFSNVTKYYKRADGSRRYVLRDATIELPDDETIAVMAPKLGGKSTMVRLITGFETPDEGEVLRYKDVSYPVGTTTVLASNMTGRENIAFISRVFNCDGALISDFVGKHAELGGALDREVALYAPEEKSRLAFILSYAITFDTYVIDGNIGRGSEAFREKCAAFLEVRLKRSGLILATANPKLALTYCRKVLVIDDCSLVLHDDPDAGIEHFKELVAKQKELGGPPI